MIPKEDQFFHPRTKSLLFSNQVKIRKPLVAEIGRARSSEGPYGTLSRDVGFPVAGKLAAA